MMKVLIMGAGGQGAPTAMVFCNNEEVAEVLLGDINAELLERVKNRIRNPKLKTVKVDANNIGQIAEAAKGADVIVDLLIPAFTEKVMGAALEAGTHYVNTAWDEWLLEGYEKQDVVLGAKPKMFQAFQEKGLTALFGCGYSPGFATNVLIRHYSDKLDTVESIDIYLIKKDLSIPPEADVLRPWKPGWAPQLAIEDQMYPKYRFENGKFIKLTEIFAEAEIRVFPEPFGKMLVAAHCHEETYGIPHALAPKGLKHLSFKYYIDGHLGTLISTGLCSEEEVEINGVKVRPKDVVLAKVEIPGDAFMNEDPELFDKMDKERLVNISFEIKGTKDGKTVKYIISSPEGSLETPRQKMYDLYGTSIIGVALPVMVGAKIMLDGCQHGVIQPHELDSDKFISLMKKYKYPNEWKEIKEETK